MTQLVCTNDQERTGGKEIVFQASNGFLPCSESTEGPSAVASVTNN